MTDRTEYSWTVGLTDSAPQLEAATYRFRPSTGVVTVVEDSLVQPNGIAISPRKADGNQTVYISDTGSISGTTVQSLGPRGESFNTTGKRTLYTFDLTADGNHIVNKRPIYLAQDWVPDGLKVAANGYVCKLNPNSSVYGADFNVVTAAGKGIDVIDPHDGAVLVRVQTNFTVQNFAVRILLETYLNLNAP